MNTMPIRKYNLALAQLAVILTLTLAATRLVAQPVNDTFTNRISLTGNPATFSGNTSGATPDEEFSWWQVYSTTPTVWWSWTASESSMAVLECLNSTNSPQGTALVFSGSHYLAPDWVSHGSFELRKVDPAVAFPTVAGQVYHILLATDETTDFNFRITTTNAPYFRLQPQTASAGLNSGAVFTAMVMALEWPSFQWQFNGVNIPNATNYMLVLEPVSRSQVGDYRVIARVGTNTSVSAVAQLVITNAPVTVKALGLANGEFSFSATGAVGANYLLDTSTNLVDWPVVNQRSVLGTNATTTFNVIADAPAKFVRLSPAPSEYDACVFRRHKIAAATQLAALVFQWRDTDQPQLSEIASFLDAVPDCPQGGYYYLGITYVTSGPFCPYHFP